RILADPGFDGALRTRPGGAEVHPPDGDEAARLATEDPRVRAVLARRGKLAEDLGWLAAPALGLPRVADLALSVVAQGVLRAFAARLPGFHASGLPYLFASFLDVAATVEVEPERWVVRLGRPPLQFVLALSGAARGEHRPGWMRGITLALCQEGE
ncbi:MAG TPA: hypothetical protein VHG28_11655, partial [Longimicrobiaceae bacterium]|nr:hypothetical protein [Longimicrobiaceae bacterium]